jgi:hypothetical protein
MMASMAIIGPIITAGFSSAFWADAGDAMAKVAAAIHNRDSRFVFIM